MNYLGIDYGKSKIGLATGFGNIAVPSGIIPSKDALSSIPKIVREKDIGIIVIGIANHMDGRISEQTQRTRSFVGSLKKGLDPQIKIVEWDERLSTFEARMALSQTWHKHGMEWQVDDIAAMIILQSYLENLNRT